MMLAAATLGMFGGTEASAQSKQLTLCWAAWDPANALVELGKDFTKESGIEMKYEFVPWTSYADRFLNELNSRGKLCDLIIGDSQWIGGAAENGHYVKLNDFFAKEKISMDDFVKASAIASGMPASTNACRRFGARHAIQSSAIAYRKVGCRDHAAMIRPTPPTQMRRFPNRSISRSARPL